LVTLLKGDASSGSTRSNHLDILLFSVSVSCRSVVGAGLHWFLLLEFFFCRLFAVDVVGALAAPLTSAKKWFKVDGTDGQGPTLWPYLPTTATGGPKKRRFES
jgi:hypothetical protein